MLAYTPDGLVATGRPHIAKPGVLPLPNLYYNYYYPNPKYLIIGHLDPLGNSLVKDLEILQILNPKPACPYQPPERESYWGQKLDLRWP